AAAASALVRLASRRNAAVARGAVAATTGRLRLPAFPYRHRSTHRRRCVATPHAPDSAAAHTAPVRGGNEGRDETLPPLPLRPYRKRCRTMRAAFSRRRPGGNRCR